MSTTSSALMIAFHDGIGELITPTANFTPVSGFPLSNLTNSQLFSRTRTPDLTADRQLTWDLGSSIESNVFMLAGCNSSLAATGRFRGADDSGFTTNVIQSGSSLTDIFDDSLFTISPYLPPWGRTIIYVHPDSFSKRYIRWHQTDSSNSDGYMEWGVARIGLGLQFPFTSIRYPPIIVGSKGAQKVLRGCEITVSNISETQANDIESMFLQGLEIRRFLIISEPLRPATFLSNAFWGVFEGVTVKEPITSFSSFRVVLNFREVGY